MAGLDISLTEIFHTARIRELYYVNMLISPEWDYLNHRTEIKLTRSEKISKEWVKLTRLWVSLAYEVCNVVSLKPTRNVVH